MFIKEDFKMDFNKIKEAAQNYGSGYDKISQRDRKIPG